MTARRGIVFGLLVLAIWFFWQSLDLGHFARRVPLPVSAGLIVLLVAEVARTFRRTAEGESPGSLDRASIAAVAAVLALPMAVWLVGLYAGIAVFTAGFLRLRGGESALVALLAAVACSGAVWALASRLLQMTPPPGVLVALLSG